MGTSDVLAALFAVEHAAGATTFAARRATNSLPGLTSAPSAADAVRAATRLASEGTRASVMLAPDELLAAAEAIAQAARQRAPIVVHVVALATRDAEHLTTGRDDIGAALELGAGVVVSFSSTDAIDLALAVRRAGEDSETPFLHIHDGGHDTPVEHVATDLVARFLGSRRADAPPPKGEAMQKRIERSFAARVPFALASALRELGEITGRQIGVLERVETTDAEEIVVAVGSAFPPAKAVAAELRRAGRRVGALGIRALRPFYGADVVKTLARAKAVGVVEPLDSALAPSGPCALALKAAFADALTWAPGHPGIGHIPPIVSAGFATIEGAIDSTPIARVFEELTARDRARRVLTFGSDES